MVTNTPMECPDLPEVTIITQSNFLAKLYMGEACIIIRLGERRNGVRRDEL